MTWSLPKQIVHKSKYYVQVVIVWRLADACGQSARNDLLARDRASLRQVDLSSCGCGESRCDRHIAAAARRDDDPRWRWADLGAFERARGSPNGRD